VNATGVDLDEEEHVEASEPKRLDGEEVAGDDRGRVGPQELTPAEPSPRICRRQPGLAKNLRDARRRDSDADACQLADDSLVAPTSVLARKAQHQLAGLC
jgi:hypothetical protein